MKDKYNGRTRKQLRILQCFTYNDEDCMTLEIYDKKTKKMYVGTIRQSSWTYKEKLDSLKKVKLKPLEN